MLILGPKMPIHPISNTKRHFKCFKWGKWEFLDSKINISQLSFKSEPYVSSMLYMTTAFRKSKKVPVLDFKGKFILYSK